METDQESLLNDRNNCRSSNNVGSTKWRKNLFLLIIVISLVLCLFVYFYLNIQAIDEDLPSTNQYKPLSRRKPMLDHESIFSDSGPSMIKLSDLFAHCIVALRIAGEEVVNLSLKKNNKIVNIGSKGKTREGVDDIVTGVDIKSHHMILNTIKDSYRRLNIVSEEDATKEFENTKLEDDLLPIDRAQFAQLLRNQLHEIESQHADQGSLITQHETLVWIDPLDATKEYSENLTDYVTLMACIVHKSVPVAGVIFRPFTNETYWSLHDEASGLSYRSPDLSRALRKKQSFSPRGDKLKVIVSRSHAGDVNQNLRDLYNDRVDITTAGGSGYKSIKLLNGQFDAYLHLTHIKRWDICAPHAIINSIPGASLTNLNGKSIGFGDPKDVLVTNGLIATADKDIHKELVNSFKSMKSLES